VGHVAPTTGDASLQHALDILRQQQQKIPASLQPHFSSPYLEDLRTHTVQSDRTWLTVQALPDLHDHLRALREEFTGQLEIVYFHASLIVKIRRRIDLEESFAAFRSLWSKDGLRLLRLLNTRWIVSALDSFVDHGEDDERGGAMAIATFVNMLKLSETEHRLAGSPEHAAERIADNSDNIPQLWDGVRSFRVTDDDTFANMVQRMRRMLAPTPLFILIFESLLNRATSNPTLLTRLAQHHRRHLW
jgi:hypothetical protein